MLLARYAPIGSPRYEKLSKSSVKLDKIIKWLPAQLFGIWTVFVAGMSAGKAQVDRFYFWDWSDWLIGIIGIGTISIVFSLLHKRFKSFAYNDENISFKTWGYHVSMPFILFSLGYLIVGSFSITKGLIYVLAYFALFIIYTIIIDESNSVISSESKKHIKTFSSVLLLLITAIIGFLIDDPIIATASLVSLPFLMVLLFGSHVRHLERAKFYPIFIFAMFVTSREAWFLIPLILLFFVLRSYNYIRNQKVYPTFGVSETE